MNIDGHRELFGTPFWREEPNPTVHAFVAGVHDSDERTEIQIEVVSAASFDRQYERFQEDPVALFGGLKTSPAILELDLPRARQLFQVNEAESLEGSWRTFSLEANGGGERRISLLETLADSEGSIFGIGPTQETPPQVRQSHAATLGTLVDERQVHQLLRPFTNYELEVAVLDVGQGAASFLFSGSFLPLVYFDMGGGVAKHARTFPTTGVDWCFTNDPAVILSHWHWDHWAGATYGGVNNVAKALRAKWLAPDQKTGPHTNKFRAKVISSGGSILLWPTGLAPISSGYVTIGRANGSDANDSGLVILLESPMGRFSLLPGDAAYTCVPSSMSHKYSRGLRTLVISHHGGKLNGLPPYNIPMPDGLDGNVALYSVGVGNTYGHPIPATEAAHKNAGWKTIVRTDNRFGLAAHHLFAHTGGTAGGTMTPACGGMGSPHCSLTLHE
ncbi:ComEC/Rec2 family competence protein [Rhodoferax antarcticus]|uniref:hypothetical protein n=1 Tax=Rhodoferax antarcticus TaxID=81479 RepID=UPI0022252655|nr:hypothetical protein [Rhodoferax antarcticus]MCW2313719.1 beta-lactamase superfamily II metal-dependent hydrolase [Rhodoferax antarcticus]